MDVVCGVVFPGLGGGDSLLGAYVSIYLLKVIRLFGEIREMKDGMIMGERVEKTSGVSRKGRFNYWVQ